MKRIFIALVATAAVHAQDVILFDKVDAAVDCSFAFTDDLEKTVVDRTSFQLVNGNQSDGANAAARFDLIQVHDVEYRDESGSPAPEDEVTNLQAVYLERTITYEPTVDGAISAILFSKDFISDYDAIISAALGNRADGSAFWNGGFYTWRQ